MEIITYQTDPARLASGQWCHARQRQIGEGDISASYSADHIGMSQPIRKPFTWQSGLWVCVGMASRRGHIFAEAYRILPQSAFPYPVRAYAEKTRNSDEARADPNGFYHGMSVRHGSKTFVLIGPPVRFAPGESCEQLSLF